MNKQAIETEYKRICDKLGFIPKELSTDEMLFLYENGYLTN